MKTTLFQQKQILRKKALRVRNAISKIDQKKYSEIIFKLIEEKNQLKEEAEKDFKKLESKIYYLHYEVEEYEGNRLTLVFFNLLEGTDQEDLLI